ncbi:hypothetical protein D3C77_730240 [compost metagenome]
MLTQYDADHAIRLGEQARQLQDTLAWHDDLVAVGLADVSPHGAHGQTVTVGRYGA